MKQVIQIPGAPAPVGPYSQAILVNGTLYVSGQIPIDPKTGDFVDDSIEDSTHQVMKNILALVEAAEMTADNIVKCSIFLKDMEDYPRVNDVYATYFDLAPPAREAVRVVNLPMNVDIEISCIAVK